jgi:hypothetical protein
MRYPHNGVSCSCKKVKGTRKLSKNYMGQFPRWKKQTKKQGSKYLTCYLGKKGKIYKYVCIYCTGNKHM